MDDVERRMKEVVSRTSNTYRSPSLDSKQSIDRCPRCATPLNGDQGAAVWTMAPFMRDSFSLLGAAFGCSTGGLYAFNSIMPFLGKRIPSKVHLQYFFGFPPVILFSIGCAGLGAGAFPGFAQLAISSYHYTAAVSHLSISNLTQRVESRTIEVGERPDGWCKKLNCMFGCTGPIACDQDRDQDQDQDQDAL